MAWVRYDDGFYSHPKVTAVLAEDAGAIALHVLANTWSCQQRRPGFVPTHQPAVLVGKHKGTKWAALLEQYGLWDRVEGGWEFHDHEQYRVKTRQTPGTPADLSAKRAAAGRKGGQAAQQAKQQAKQSVEQTQASDEQHAATLLSPVVASNEATPVPVPTTSARDAPPDAGAVVAAFVDSARGSGFDRPGKSVIGRVGKAARQLLAEGGTRADLLIAAQRLGANGWDDLEREVRRVQSERYVLPDRFRRPNKAEERDRRNLALIEHFSPDKQGEIA